MRVILVVVVVFFYSDASQLRIFGDLTSVDLISIASFQLKYILPLKKSNSLEISI